MRTLARCQAGDDNALSTVCGDPPAPRAVECTYVFTCSRYPLLPTHHRRNIRCSGN